jgi:CheY-like chemotaxis protein
MSCEQRSAQQESDDRIALPDALSHLEKSERRVWVMLTGRQKRVRQHVAPWVTFLHCHASMARCVLIVEDDADAREMMAQLLSAEGFEPRLAVNGRDAIDQLAAGFTPDVILLDLMMPVMDGQHFLEQCRRDPRCAGIPVIVLSATSDRTPHVEASAVFRKPLDFARVLDTVRRLSHTDDDAASARSYPGAHDAGADEGSGPRGSKPPMRRRL